MASAVHASHPSYLGPRFADAHVHDAMRVGLVTCRPETTLPDIGRMMVGYGIHAVVVSGPGDARPSGIVTSLDLARAGAEIGSSTAADVATTDLVTIESSESLQRAAELMAEHGISHLIAVQPGTDRPAGMISASTIAAAIAYGRP